MSLQVVVKSVYNRLPAIRARLPEGASEVVESVGEEMVTEIRAGIHNVTGYMSSTVEARATSAMNVIVSVGAYYASYVEFGTRRNRAYPFFYPAIDRVGPSFVQRMSAMLEGL